MANMAHDTFRSRKNKINHKHPGSACFRLLTFNNHLSCWDRFPGMLYLCTSGSHKETIYYLESLLLKQERKSWKRLERETRERQEAAGSRERVGTNNSSYAFPNPNVFRFHPTSISPNSIQHRIVSVRLTSRSSVHRSKCWFDGFDRILVRCPLYCIPTAIPTFKFSTAKQCLLLFLFLFLLLFLFVAQ